MNFLEMFNMVNDNLPVDSSNPQQEPVDTNYYEPTFVDQPPSGWQDEFSGFRTRPVLYNMDGYISPYASNNWGGTSSILKTLDDVSRLPPLSDKVDPNKIFTSDISALRTQAADQMKVTKMFEKRLMESLTDRGKVGLNENDIMAMQALTSARASVTAIQKEQIAIKKNIADIRIKQQQNTGAKSGEGNVMNNGRGPSSFDVGRSILDDIFNSPASTTPQPVQTEYNAMPQSAASQLIDNLIPNSSVTSHIQYEAAGPTTYVRLTSDSDDSAEFVTLSATGEVLSDYPNPTTAITKIDRDAKTAVDELLVQYPILE